MQKVKIERQTDSGISVSVTGDDVREQDALIASLLIELAVERKAENLEITTEVMDEIIIRARRKGYDAITGEWLH